jgi:hypothetical protein
MAASKPSTEGSKSWEEVRLERVRKEASRSNSDCARESI